MRTAMSELPQVYAGRDFDRTDRLLVRFGTHTRAEAVRVSANFPWGFDIAQFSPAGHLSLAAIDTTVRDRSATPTWRTRRE